MEYEHQIASISCQIANSYAQQLDLYLKEFLQKNLIPFDGNIEKTNNMLASKGMRLIAEDYPLNTFGAKKTVYMLVKILDSTSITIKPPKFTIEEQE